MHLTVFLPYFSSVKAGSGIVILAVGAPDSSGSFSFIHYDVQCWGGDFRHSLPPAFPISPECRHRCSSLREWVQQRLAAGKSVRRGHKKARPAVDAGRAFGLNYLEDTGAGAGAGAGAVGQHEAAKTEAAAAITRNLTVFIVVFWLLVSLHLREVTHSAAIDY